MHVHIEPHSVDQRQYCHQCGHCCVEVKKEDKVNTFYKNCLFVADTDMCALEILQKLGKFKMDLC